MFWLFCVDWVKYGFLYVKDNSEDFLFFLRILCSFLDDVDLVGIYLLFFVGLELVRGTGCLSPSCYAISQMRF